MNQTRKDARAEVVRPSWRAIADYPVIYLVPTALVLLLAFAAPVSWVLAISITKDNHIDFHGYSELLSSSLYIRVLLNTLTISLSSTALTLLLGFPVAYHLARHDVKARSLLKILVFLPLWTSILVKSFAFTVLFGSEGLINSTLRAVVGPSAALNLLFTRQAVLFGMAHYLLPFMILSIEANLVSQDRNLRVASEVMGSSRMNTFLKITLPLSLPGIVSGCIICFILSMGIFVTPALLGGPGDMMISNLIEFHVRETLDWSAASALATLLVIFTIALTFVLRKLGGSLRIGGG